VQDMTTALAFTPDGNWLLAGTRSGWLHRWDLRQPSPTAVSWQAHKDVVTELAPAPDGSAFYSASQDGTVARFGTVDWQQTARFTDNAAVQALAVCGRGGRVLCGGAGRLTVLDYDLRPTPGALSLPLGCSALALGPDGDTLALAHGRILRLLD